MTRKSRRCVVTTILAALAMLEATADTSVRLTALPGTVRVRQEGPVEGTDTVRIGCARNEYEAFQVVITPLEGNIEKVGAQLSPLQKDDGTTLDPSNVTLFREIFVPVRQSAPRATCPPGLVPEPLVPFVNPYTGEPIPEPKWQDKEPLGARFGATGFAVWRDMHQPLWVDVYVPKDAAPGVYTGRFRVEASDGLSAELPVELTVWDFVLPDGPTHENSFGGFERVAAYHNIETDSEQYATLEDRYAAMLAAHRISPDLPKRLRPRPAEDGSVTFDDAADQAITDFVTRHHVTNLEIPRAPFGDVLGADREKAKRFYQSWYAYLEKKGWADRAYLYVLDEPNTPEQYEEVRKLGELVHEAEPRIRRLVVEQPYTQDPAWGTLDEAIDIWCPLFGFVHEPSVQRVLGQGDTVWSYSALVQKAPPYHPEYESVKADDPPYWQIDFPLSAYRVAPWLNRRYGITGLLYWSTVYWGSPDRNPWDDPGFRMRWNGDGFLFYPGDEAGIEGPVASLRLKNLRDGMEDYEYFVLLEQRGGKEVVDAIVREEVPTWGTWVQAPNRMPELRERLAEEIVKRAGKE